MTEAEHERTLQCIAAAQFADIIELRDRAPPPPYFMRAYLNGVLSAIAAHLVREHGPQSAYECFQRLADECAANFLH